MLVVAWPGAAPSDTAVIRVLAIRSALMAAARLSAVVKPTALVLSTTEIVVPLTVIVGPMLLPRFDFVKTRLIPLPAVPGALAVNVTVASAAPLVLKLVEA